MKSRRYLLRIEEENFQKLQKIADKESRSVASLVRRAVIELIERRLKMRTIRVKNCGSDCPFYFYKGEQSLFECKLLGSSICEYPTPAEKFPSFCPLKEER